LYQWGYGSGKGQDIVHASARGWLVVYFFM
jgi:hypothetical protein